MSQSITDNCFWAINYTLFALNKGYDCSQLETKLEKVCNAKDSEEENQALIAFAEEHFKLTGEKLVFKETCVEEFYDPT
jgi:hypothetical protein